MAAGDDHLLPDRDDRAPSPDLFRRADALFDAALDLPTVDRIPFIERKCATDAELLEVVHDLLEAHDRAAAFLETPAAVIGLPLLTSASAGSPSRAGPFRVVRQIGVGGMGAVFLGERDDGQFEQRVALKFVRVGEAQLVRRFLAERRILASLEHASIARLVDGGLTDSGLPYFAMEYVEGEPVTVYCDRRQLPVEDRLRLFVDVCAAVEFAHRKRVVHCDLKPGNILVTQDGAVKLLDFGIARLLQVDTDDASVMGTQLMTPEYASPELLRGEAPTEATDQYALGTLLYELLTGRHPFRVSGVPRQPVDLRGMRQSPVAPSVLVARPGLCRDLDAIVLRAMASDPTSRYGGVSDLAADIRRHLNHRPGAAGLHARATNRGRYVAGIAAAGALMVLSLGTMARSGSAVPALVTVASVRAVEVAAAEAAMALPELLSTRLAAVPGLEVVSRARMMELVGEGHGELEAARLARAGSMLQGELFAHAAGGYRLELHRIDVASGRIMATHVLEGAEPDRLAYEAAAAVARALDLPEPPAREAARHVVAASALYEAGLQAYYRDADRRAAYRLFVAALAEDTTYAAAAFLAGRAATEIFPDSVFRYLQLAERLAVSLADRDRLLIAAHAAAVFDDPRALAVAETLSVRYPQDASAAFQYGAALLARGDFAAAGVALRRALALDPLPSGRGRSACIPCDAYSSLIRMYVLVDSFPAALTLARDAAKLQPGSTAAWQQLADILDVLELHDEAAGARRRLVELRPGEALRDVDEARTQLRRGNFTAADRILVAAAGSVDRSVAAAALWLQVVSFRQQGRLADAARAAERYDLVQMDVAGRSAPLRSLLKVSVYLDAAQPRRAVQLLDSTFRTLPDHGRVSRNARDQAWLLTLKGDALAAAGDTTPLPALADSIRALGALSAYGRDPRLHHHVRGLLHSARGDFARAEAEFRAATYSVIGGYTRTNHALARSLVQQGRAAEAIPLLQATLRAPLDGPALYLTRTEVHAALAHAFDATGQPDSAAVHHAHVVHAWRESDAALQNRWLDARRRLAEALRRH
ncbi:MAG TPA: protein kinase [Longimicrobiales bacterium]|nr:protein kinase [Longimicrobiales bacterium]